MLQDTVKIFKAILYTIRPSATLGSCLLMLAAFNPQRDEFGQAVPLMLTAFFGSAFCFLVNDIYDRDKDLLNNKRRPVATGIIPIKTAIYTAIFFGAVFVSSASLLGTPSIILSIVFLGITSFYSYVNAKTGFLSNIIVALIVSLTQVWVMLLKPDELLLISGVFLLFFTIPREILLDWLDMPGDKKIGKKSIPLSHSTNRVKQLIVIFLVLSCVPLCYAIILLNYNDLLTVFLVITLLTSWISFIPFFNKSNDNGALTSVRISHITYAFLILALFSR